VTVNVIIIRKYAVKKRQKHRCILLLSAYIKQYKQN